MLINNWRQAWKFFSVHLMMLIGLIASLEPFLPQLESVLPDGWVAYAMPIVLIARLIKQNNIGAEDDY